MRRCAEAPGVRRSGLCLLLLAAVLAAYGPALLHGGFTWDDYKFVEANPRLGVCAAEGDATID